MILVNAQPSLNEIDGFTSKVTSFPVSASQLTKLARDIGASPKIINFYKKFAPYRVFSDSDDLTASSQQVDILRTEESQMPKEEAVPAED